VSLNPRSNSYLNATKTTGAFLNTILEIMLEKHLINIEK
jgi:hypothetical protein